MKYNVISYFFSLNERYFILEAIVRPAFLDTGSFKMLLQNLCALFSWGFCLLNGFFLKTMPLASDFLLPFFA